MQAVRSRVIGDRRFGPVRRLAKWQHGDVVARGLDDRLSQRRTLRRHFGPAALRLQTEPLRQPRPPHVGVDQHRLDPTFNQPPRGTEQQRGGAFPPIPTAKGQYLLPAGVDRQQGVGQAVEFLGCPGNQTPASPRPRELIDLPRRPQRNGLGFHRHVRKVLHNVPGLRSGRRLRDFSLNISRLQFGQKVRDFLHNGRRLRSRG